MMRKRWNEPRTIPSFKNRAIVHHTIIFRQKVKYGMMGRIGIPGEPKASNMGRDIALSLNLAYKVTFKMKTNERFI